MKPIKPVHSFSLSFNGLAPQLITAVDISATYDPAKPPPTLPTTLKVNALWDTGATHTSISYGLAKTLGLTSVGTGVVTHAGGKSSCNRYIINLVLPNKITVVGVFVNECTLPTEFDMLIGMDIITGGDFSLTHFGGKTLFSFRIPSIESVDYVKIQNAKAFAGVGANAPCPCGSGKKFKKCHKP